MRQVLGNVDFGGRLVILNEKPAPNTLALASEGHPEQPLLQILPSRHNPPLLCCSPAYKSSSLLFRTNLHQRLAGVCATVAALGLPRSHRNPSITHSSDTDRGLLHAGGAKSGVPLDPTRQTIWQPD